MAVGARFDGMRVYVCTAWNAKTYVVRMHLLCPGTSLMVFAVVLLELRQNLKFFLKTNITLYNFTDSLTT